MKIRIILYSCYVLFLLVFTVFISVKPYYNFDMVPYMAIVQKLDGAGSIQQIQATSYQEAQKKISPRDYQDLISASDYRSIMFQDEASFDEQLSFYVIKPLYLLSAFLFYKAGVSLAFSTVLPSLISFFIIGLMMLKWVNKILPSPWLCLWACLFIMTSEPLINLGKSSAPDGLAIVFLLAGCFLLIEKRCLWSSFLFFTLSILTRPDYIILVFFLFLIIFMGKWYRKVPLGELIICLSLTFIAYFLPKLFLEEGSWSTLFNHAFISRVSFPLSDPPSFSISQYLAVIGDRMVHSTYFAVSCLLLFVLFAGTVLWDRLRFPSFKLRDWTFHQAFMLALVASIVVRFFLFPAFFVRFMVPFLLLSAIIFIKEVYLLLPSKVKDRSIERTTDHFVES